MTKSLAPSVLKRTGPIVLVLCLTYILSQFFRSSIAVIGFDLRRDLNLTSNELGFLMSSFFYVVAITQIPVGVMLDRFGPRSTMGVLLMAASVGATLFSFAHSFASLTIARGLMGIGTSSILMGSLLLFSRLFPPSQFAQLSGLLIAVGTAGNIISTLPLAYASGHVGWRAVFAWAGIISLLASASVLATLPSQSGKEIHHGRAPESVGLIVKGLIDAVRIKGFLPIFCMNFTGYAIGITVLGLWGGPFLTDVYGLNTVERGQALFLMPLGSIAGFLLLGSLDRMFDTRKKLVLFGASCNSATLFLLAYWGKPPLPLALGLLCLVGFLGGFFTFVLAHGRGIFPARVLGRGMSLLNAGTVSGAAIIQTLSSYVISIFWRGDEERIPLVAYQAMFFFLGAILVAAIAIYSFSTDVRPSQEQA